MYHKWQESMYKWCEKHNADVTGKDGEYIFTTAKKPSEAEILELSKILEEKGQAFQVVEGLKPSTGQKIIGSCSMFGVQVKISDEDGQGIVAVAGPPELKKDLTFVETFSQWLRDDGYFKSWTVTLNGHILATVNLGLSDEIEKNNGNREQIISKDEIMDVKILVGGVDTIDELLAKLGG